MRTTTLILKSAPAQLNWRPCASMADLNHGGRSPLAPIKLAESTCTLSGSHADLTRSLCLQRPCPDSKPLWRSRCWRRRWRARSLSLPPRIQCHSTTTLSLTGCRHPTGLTDSSRTQTPSIREASWASHAQAAESIIHLRVDEPLHTSQLVLIDRFKKTQKELKS